jgi:hypothetical protein
MKTAMMVLFIIYVIRWIMEDNKPVLTKAVYDMNNEQDRKEIEAYDNWYYNRKSFSRV